MEVECIAGRCAEVEIQAKVSGQLVHRNSVVRAWLRRRRSGLEPRRGLRHLCRAVDHGPAHSNGIDPVDKLPERLVGVGQQWLIGLTLL